MRDRTGVCRHGPARLRYAPDAVEITCYSSTFSTLPASASPGANPGPSDPAMTPSPAIPFPPAGPVFTADCAQGLLAFDGADAAAFLHGQLSTDVAAMAVGDAAWSSYNSPKGRMLGTLLLCRLAPDAFRALVAADLAEPLRRRLAMFVLRAKVAVADLSAGGRRFGVAGPGADDAVRTALGLASAPAPGHAVAAGDALAAVTPDGRCLVHVPAGDEDAVTARLAAHARPLAADAWALFGIRAGVPAIGEATTDLFVPQAANWDLVGGVNFRKGCYPGQEIVARMQYLGRLKERLYAFHLDGPPPAPATPLYGDVFGDQACGTVVNAAPAPAGGSDLLAVAQIAAVAGGPLRVGAPNGPALAAGALPYPVPDPAAPERPRL